MIKVFKIVTVLAVISISGRVSADTPVASIPLPLSNYSAKQNSTGDFVDNSGKNHHWEISNSHVLNWDSTPYLPVGGVYQPYYWTEQTTEAWNKDVKALETLKQNGVIDLYLYAGKQGITKVPVSACQKIIDYLDNSSFRYGLECGDYPKSDLIGYVIKPAIYRSIINPGNDTKFDQLTGLESAIFAITSKSTDELPVIGSAAIDDNSATIPAKNSNSLDSIILLYPKRSFHSGTPESHMPDLWQGYDEYRDRLLSYFKKIHFGAGLRFIIDPLTDKIGINGDAESIVPASEGFRLEFQAWLEKKYNNNNDDINRAWGIKERDLPDFVSASRCIPLWNKYRGIPGIYDPIKKQYFAVINKPVIASHYWEDLNSFITQSIKGYMNSIAGVIKSSIANVPVIYKFSKYSPFFINDRTTLCFDGLGIEANGHGYDLAKNYGGYALAASEDSALSGWIMVSGLSDDSKDADTHESFTSRAALFNDFDYLRDCSARGFFINALQLLPDDKYKSINMIVAQDRLPWLASYSALLQIAASDLAKDNKKILWYPATDNDLTPRKIGANLWWLPSSHPGSDVNFGPKVKVYQILNMDGGFPTFVVWSPNNQYKELRLLYNKQVTPIISNVLGQQLRINPKKGFYTVPVGNDPILINNVSSIPLPLELVNEIEHDTETLLKIAEEQHVAMQLYKDQYFYAKNSASESVEELNFKYGRFQRLLAELNDILIPYSWIEGESASRYSFDSIVASNDASNGAYLTLDNNNDPPIMENGDKGFSAAYSFKVNKPGRYMVWMAGSNMESPDTSPFTYSFDDGLPEEVHSIAADGKPYGEALYWTNLGETTFTSAGNHTLKIVVNARRRSDNHFTLSIDSFCIIRVPFKPDGTNKPSIDTYREKEFDIDSSDKKNGK